MNLNNEEGIIFFELQNKEGVVIARSGELNTLPDKFSISSNSNFTEAGYRNIYRTNNNGSVHLIVKADHELFQGNKSVQRAGNIYLSFIPKFSQIATSQRQSFDAVIRRFSHNLIKFQRRFKDNFNTLISDKSRGRPYAEFKEEVKRRIEENTDIAANDVCQMSHRAMDLDAQIETLRILAGYADSTGSFLPVNIQKAMHRLTNPFIDELRKKNIKILINIDNELASRNKIQIVHSLFNAALWQIFDNISKYTLHDTDVEVTAELTSKPKKLIISMISVTIEESEKETIFLENRQGRNVKKSKEDKSGVAQDGTGIGLFIVRKALNFMKAKISVKNNGFVVEENTYPYSKHDFIIEFNNES
jgi:signal transduction histidine kinase